MRRHQHIPQAPRGQARLPIADDGPDRVESDAAELFDRYVRATERLDTPRALALQQSLRRLGYSVVFLGRKDGRP